MKQSLIKTSNFNIDYIPEMLPYLIQGYFNENPFVNSEQDTLKKLKEEKIENTSIVQENSKIGLNRLLIQRNKINGRTGIHFNLMIIGKNGVGKSTIIKKLFQLTTTSVPQPKEYHLELLYDNKYKIKVNINEIESTFGSKFNNKFNWVEPVNIIEEYKRQYIKIENNLIRQKPLWDNRIHAILFVLEPYQISYMELIAMKELSEVVNLIPVVNKIDILNGEEEVESVEKDLERMLDIFGIIPCKDILSVKRDIQPFMVSKDNITLLQKFIIDDHMIDLIDGTETQFEIERSLIMQEEMDMLKNTSPRMVISKDWWWKEPYLMEQIEFQSRYKWLNGCQHGKFQEWIQCLLIKQTNLNKEIEFELDKIELARVECQELETILLHLKLKGSVPITTTTTGNNSDKTLVVTNPSIHDNDSLMENGGYINHRE